MKFGTKAIHKGVQPDPSTGAIMTPIYQTSTYQQKAPGDHLGYEYARVQNPTRDTLENNLAALENAEYAYCFGSGMSAIDTIIRLLRPGDEVIATNDLYGGSYRIFMEIFKDFGLHFQFIDTSNPEAIEAAITDKTKMLWIETPTNPVLKITDIAHASQIAHNKNLWVCVDNTFASPYLQNPLDEGADIVVHSATKYLGGHSDVVLGAVMTNDSGIAENIQFIQKTVGAVPGPQDCFLVLRGIKTLHLRMPQHCKNAAALARILEDHPQTDKIYWPGFQDGPNHQIAAKQMRDFGGMVSFTLKGDRYEDAVKVLQSTELFTLAESLGGVESLIGHPASMTHASIPKEERALLGVTDSFIRLSIGVEDENDLVQDLTHALKAIE